MGHYNFETVFKLLVLHYHYKHKVKVKKFTELTQREHVAAMLETSI
jgi:hypothetical protein